MSNYFLDNINPNPSVIPQPFRDTSVKEQEEQFSSLYRWMQWKYQHSKKPNEIVLPVSNNSCTRPHYSNDLSFRSRFSYDKDIYDLINTACKDIKFKENENPNFSLLMYNMEPDPRQLDLLILEDPDLLKLLTSKTADFGKPVNPKKTTDRKRAKRKGKRIPRPMKILEPILEVEEEDDKEIVIPMDFLNKYPVNDDWVTDHIVTCGFPTI